VGRAELPVWVAATSTLPHAGEAPAAGVRPSIPALESEEERAAGASRLPLIAVVASSGVLVVSIAFWLSRSNPGSSPAELLFWVGLGLIVLVPAARLIGTGAARGERVGLVVTVGLLLYAVKVIHDPFGFTYADEWVHVYNAQEIARTGSLFHANPLIGVTPRYPGLESATVAISSLTHLGLFASGVIVVGVARILAALGLFLLLEGVTGSARLAGIGGVVYATNPNFLFWSGQFSYESLALALAIFAAAAAVKSVRTGTAHRRAWTAVSSLAVLATVVTHHLTAIALAVFLVAVCILAGVRSATRGRAPWIPAGLSVAAIVLWIREVAPGTTGYLFPVIGRAFHQVVATVLGHASGRHLFGGGSAGQPVAPEWARLVALASVGLIVLALPFGLVSAYRRGFLRNPFALVLAAAAVLYVAVLPMRLVPAAWETSNRSSEFLFLGVALLLAAIPAARRQVSRRFVAGSCAYLAVLLIGGIIAGWPPRVLLALPFRATGSGGVTIVPGPAAVAVWARTALGPGHRFIAPEAIGRELLVNGDQIAYVTSAPFNAATVIYGPEITSGIVDTLTNHSIGYVVVDHRAAGDDSMAGYFFRSPDDGQQVDRASDSKFESFPGIDRVYDSGDIVVYNVKVLRGAS
jgi:hypothetical protein